MTIPVLHFGIKLASQRSLGRLEGKRGVIDGCDMIDGRRRFSVGRRSFLVDVPAILDFRYLMPCDDHFPDTLVQVHHLAVQAVQE